MAPTRHDLLSRCDRRGANYACRDSHFPAGSPLILSLVVAALTSGLVLARPKGLPEGYAALLGGIATVALGVVPPAQAIQVLQGTLPIMGFFLGMMAITAVAEQAGFFAWAANGAMHLARGSRLRLFVALFGIGAAVTVLFSNDATVLALTPLVLLLTERLHLPPLPYVVACAFVANAASTLLPMGNPLNIIVLTSFPQPLGEFVRYLALPALAAVVSSAWLLARIYRRDLSGTFELPDGESPDPPGLRLSIGLLALIGAGYLAAAALAVPLAYVALSGGLLLMVSRGLAGRLDIGGMRRHISWTIFPFVAGMFVVIQGLENGGWTRQLAAALLATVHLNPALGAASAAGLVAVAANAVNNLPVAVVMVSALHQAAGPPPELLYGTLLGADLGPSLSVTGSLATMMWLMVIRRRGLHLSGWGYLRIGVLVTPPMLLLSALALGLELSLPR